MKRQLLMSPLAATLMVFVAIGDVSAQFAVDVLSYSAGTAPAPGFTTPAAALGSPERFSGEGVFPSVVSPFSPPFLSSEVVSIGETGQLTLRLSHYALPQAGALEIGVFTNAGLVETDFPNGQAGSPVGVFGVDSAVVELSENGIDWVSLGSITFDLPTNGYTDLSDPFSNAPGSALSDFQQPFTQSLSSFDGLKYADAVNPDMLDLLAGSGGGKWLDISASGLAKVGFIRFSVADDLTTTNFKFELDAVSISHAAMGAVTVPEPGTIVLGLIVLSYWHFRRHRSESYA